VINWRAKAMGIYSVVLENRRIGDSLKIGYPLLSESLNLEERKSLEGFSSKEI